MTSSLTYATIRVNLNSILNCCLSNIHEYVCYHCISASDTTYFEEILVQRAKAEKSRIVCICYKFLFVTYFYYMGTFPNVFFIVSELIFQNVRCSLRTQQGDLTHKELLELTELYSWSFEQSNDFSLGKKKKKGMVKRKANKLREKKPSKNNNLGMFFLPPVPEVECHLLTLYDNKTNCKESAFLTFTYVLGNVCRSIQACQNQSSEDLLNSACNLSCPLICACLCIYTQPSAFSSKLVIHFFFK